MSFKPIHILSIVLQCFICFTAYGQENEVIMYNENTDSIMAVFPDSTMVVHRPDSIPADSIFITVNAEDILPVMYPDQDVFVPNSTKAVWYSAIFPGLGQVYNKKYWKLPLIYGGFMGITYGLSFNQRNYTDYSVAYRDIMSDDPNANSYEDFVPDSWTDQQKKDVLKRKKDFYRRYRDLSIIGMIAMYAACMIDAYVDAELYSFDISPDLSLKIEPTIMTEHNNYSLSMYTVGIQCSIKF